MFFIVFRDINKTVKSQSVESAKAEERLLNMDFVTAKAKELGSRRERAEVCRGVISVIAAMGETVYRFTVCYAPLFWGRSLAHFQYSRENKTMQKMYFIFHLFKKISITCL